MNAAAVLIDTNVLVYPYDRGEPDKSVQAERALDALFARRSGFVTTQVLAEFFVTVTRKLRSPLSVDRALAELAGHMRTWVVLSVTPEVVAMSAAAVKAHKFHYYDAQIWAAARLHGIRTVLSEDFASGSEVEGVRFVNPFL